MIYVMAGRPRSFDREEALQLALDAFWLDGYEETSIAKLTRTMGIHPPSLYAAFGDKHQLFSEAASSYIERFRSGLHEALQAPTARQAIDQLLTRLLKLTRDPALRPDVSCSARPAS